MAWRDVPLDIAQLEDCLGHETPPSCLVTAQDEYGCRAVQAVPLQLCLTFPLTGMEAPLGAVSDLRVVEESGRRVRLSWTGVAGATEYKVVVRNNQGESAGRGSGAAWGILSS